MILDDVYDQIAYGELRNVVLGSGDIDATTTEEGLPRAHYEKIYPFMILGLTELHKRFLLRERELTVQLQTNQVSYWLTYDFAASNSKSSEDPKYILDTADNFQNDLMQVERVYGTYLTEEVELPLNEINNGAAVRTSAYNQLIIPSDTVKAPWLLETTNLRIVYRADHPSIKKYLMTSKPGRTEIYLPPTHLEALVWYIASRATNPRGALEEFHEGNNYMAKFEAACALLTNTGYTIGNQDQNTKLVSRDFP